MIRSRFVVAITAIFLSGVSFAWAADQKEISEQVCKLETDQENAIMAHDGKFLTELYADEYIHTNYVGGTVDKKGEVGFYTSPEFTLKNGSIGSCDVHVYGDVAVATGMNNWPDAVFRTRNLSGQYRYTRVYVLRDGRWQIVASHASKVVTGS